MLQSKQLLHCLEPWSLYGLDSLWVSNSAKLNQVHETSSTLAWSDPMTHALSPKKAADRKFANKKTRLSASTLFMVQFLCSTHRTTSLKSPANILCSAVASQALTAKNSRCQVLLEALGSWLMQLKASECLRMAQRIASVLYSHMGHRPVSFSAQGGYRKSGTNLCESRVKARSAKICQAA